MIVYLPVWVAPTGHRYILGDAAGEGCIAWRDGDSDEWVPYSNFEEKLCDVFFTVKTAEAVCNKPGSGWYTILTVDIGELS